MFRKPTVSTPRRHYKIIACVVGVSLVLVTLLCCGMVTQPTHRRLVGDLLPGVEVITPKGPAIVEIISFGDAQVLMLEGGRMHFSVEAIHSMEDPITEPSNLKLRFQAQGRSNKLKEQQQIEESDPDGKERKRLARDDTMRSNGSLTTNNTERELGFGCYPNGQTVIEVGPHGKYGIIKHRGKGKSYEGSEADFSYMVDWMEDGKIYDTSAVNGSTILPCLSMGCMVQTTDPDTVKRYGTVTEILTAAQDVSDNECGNKSAEVRYEVGSYKVCLKAKRGCWDSVDTTFMPSEIEILADLDDDF